MWAIDMYLPSNIINIVFFVSYINFDIQKIYRHEAKCNNTCLFLYIFNELLDNMFKNLPIQIGNCRGN